MKKFYPLLWVVILAGVWQQAAAVTLESMRLWRAPDHTRLVFDMSGNATYQLFQLDNPYRLVIDIDDARQSAAFNKIDLSKTPITQIRSGVRHKTKLRLVLDLTQTVTPRSFFLKPNKSKPHRLVVDLYDKAPKEEQIRKATARKPSTQAKASQQPATTKTLQMQTTVRRDVLIVVDAGHGGEDPGAIGANGIYEKIVALDIAKHLAKIINARKGYRAVLTRTGDYFIPLRKRRDRARQLRADLFVSIHADAFTTPKANGASVYALSQRGATSETARLLAKKENEADLIGGVGDVSLGDKDEILRSVLVDLSMTATIGTSLDIGKEVLHHMGSIAHLHKKNVEQAGFLVLKSPDVPSILIETGFISNPKEAKKLSTAPYRKKMATVIAKGLLQYFDRTPPIGTYLASDITPNTVKKDQTNQRQQATQQESRRSTHKKSPKTRRSQQITHKVVNGDSLSEIAQQYRVSMSKIKQLNQLKSNRIRIGQVLIISEKKALPTKKTITHIVKSGETLSEIALRYKTSTAVLRKRNKLPSSTIRVGQRLTIY